MMSAGRERGAFGVLNFGQAGRMGALNRRRVLARVGLLAGALCLPAVAGANTRTVLPLGGKVMDENGIIHDGRPDILQPRNLTACELRHLGGPWWRDGAMTR